MNKEYRALRALMAQMVKMDTKASKASQDKTEPTVLMVCRAYKAQWAFKVPQAVEVAVHVTTFQPNRKPNLPISTKIGKP